MKFLLKISQAILAYLKSLHLVHLAIGFHKVSSNRSSQIDWTEVVVIAFFFWTGAGFKILEALKTLRSSPPQNPHGRQTHFLSRIPIAKPIAKEPPQSPPTNPCSLALEIITKYVLNQHEPATKW